MHEYKLWWTINFFFFSLLTTKFGKIPEQNSPVTRRRCDEVDLLSAEFSLANIVLMCSETAELLIHVAGVPHRYSLIVAPSE